MAIEIDYPRDGEIRDFSRQYRIPVAAVVRDLARIVRSSTCSSRGSWERVIPAAGMALRYHGSSRYTLRDADTSAYTRIDDDEPNEVIPYEDEHLDPPGADNGVGAVERSADRAAHLLRAALHRLRARPLTTAHSGSTSGGAASSCGRSTCRSVTSTHGAWASRTGWCR
jgi:hypothetical protein